MTPEDFSSLIDWAKESGWRTVRIEFDKQKLEKGTARAFVYDSQYGAGQFAKNAAEIDLTKEFLAKKERQAREERAIYEKLKAQFEGGE